MARWINPKTKPILEMTESGTISINGNITCDDIFDIYVALHELYAYNSEIQVGLDFSGATTTAEGLYIYLEGCQSVTSIILSNSFTSIYSLAGTQIQSITIPDSVTYIEKYAFAECHNLTSVVFESNSVWNLYGPDTIEGLNTQNYSPEQFAALICETYNCYFWDKITH